MALARVTGCTLTFVDESTYLGRVINQIMTDEDDIKRSKTPSSQTQAAAGR